MAAKKRKHVAPKDFARSAEASIIREGEGSESSMGTFPAVLASDGEASDGHILHIPGNHTPARMPMLFGHQSDAMAPAMGSIIKPVKGKTADGKNRVLRTTQVINMEGDGQMADIRRNVARLVHDGDLNAMSVRWVPLEVIRRIDLPRNHFAFIDAAEEPRDSEKYWGFFHKKSRSQEGSVVAIGADPLALKGRADDMKGRAGAVFFRALAHSIETGERADGMAEISTAFNALTESLAGARKAGLSDEDIAIMLADDLKPADMVKYNFTDEAGKPASLMIPRIARDGLLSESSEAYKAAIELHSQSVKAPEHQTQRTVESDLTPEELDAEFGRIYPELKTKKEIVYYPVEPPKIETRTVSDMSPDELFSAIAKQVQATVNQAVGRIDD